MITQWFNPAKNNHWADWFLKEHHRFTITGLSRSGKSTLFTSLMTMLKYRSEGGYQCLPLLEYLPAELVEHMWIEPIDGFEMFPVEQHIEALGKKAWPSPTEDVYGFKVLVRLRETSGVKKHLLPYTDVVFEFIDYPGEWLTDLPMLTKPFTQWSDSAWAQQMNRPQRDYAEQWHDVVAEFDFDQPPEPERVEMLVEQYRNYLLYAKQNGITLLQPGSFLLGDTGFDWRSYGFTPLPSSVSSDVTHPWTKLFDKNYRYFQKQWLTPLKSRTFRQADKQIILIDLFEGLNHSKQHLYQLKETLSYLAEVFSYGESGWFSRNILRQQAISKVAFVAAKSDLLPAAYHDDLLVLLKQITEGAVAKIKDKPVHFEHFLVSALQATDPGSTPSSLRYRGKAGQYIEAEFEPLPESLSAMSSQEHFPVLPASVPDDYLPRILSGRGLDRLLQFLLGDGHE
ncbi:YcjX family protein [Salinimonas sp. HHU 13199]|uniref:YcjX family protein n=1 Tax=Salinimonas profundi TaxID=2729140 RepID=A0ABR8LQ33_9ALTE|nr:YcjX family protein [Salinimonas profundi]MBD3587473.1 YcjX family protein [Salinimonas profundi]